MTLICEGDQVIMMNAAIYAIKMLQKGMEVQAYTVGLDTEGAIKFSGLPYLVLGYMEAKSM